MPPTVLGVPGFEQAILLSGQRPIHEPGQRIAARDLRDQRAAWLHLRDQCSEGRLNVKMLDYTV